MLKEEFIEMQRQDIETLNNDVLNSLCDLFEEILEDYPNNTEIESTKSVSGCYSEMRKFAQSKAKNGEYCFGNKQSIDFVIKYLNLERKQEKIDSNDFVDLSDFI